ncbi:MAG: hypothetical protein L0H79_08475 [Intrasporangium sp.]|uniref:PEP/pyruvate-binding domain-containing protein n=1 Tax=Intrasporangium sp. TaxID=1925024 RepID=UPI002647739C|nr:PEP/pyruvate-binding domain-containing protein [Intrasporangium sp.]MDN5795773.1 hypothetical protein [Intrasporangium sp.]
MSAIVPLAEALDPGDYGGKAVQLGVAIRCGLPVPPGCAVSVAGVAAIAAGDGNPVAELVSLLGADAVVAVRSSAVGEDSGVASFAGAHLSVLGVRGIDGVAGAVRDVHASGQAAGALAYRDRMALAEAADMAVVVQCLVDATVAGVMFTRNPVSGADELVIEASWGLGEAVVSGLVTPDHFVLDRGGNLRGSQPGEKDVALHYGPWGVQEQPVPADLVERLCLDAAELGRLYRLALSCDTAFGSREHDIEFAFCGAALSLLQRRPITRG